MRYASIIAMITVMAAHQSAEGQSAPRTADREKPDEQEAEWYGHYIILADGAAVVTVIGGAMLAIEGCGFFFTQGSSQSLCDLGGAIGIAGVASAFITPGAIHLGNGNPVAGAVSVGLRGLPVVLGLAIDDTRVREIVVPPVIISALIIDWLALPYRTRSPQRTATAAPLLSPEGGVVGAQVYGSF